MRLKWFGAVVFVLAFALVFPGVSLVSAQKVPADFTYEAAKEGKVTFSHEAHKGVGKCTACHTKVFKMKKGGSGPLTMEKMKAGQQCGACHNGKEMGGKAVFGVDDKASCDKCHKK